MDLLEFVESRTPLITLSQGTFLWFQFVAHFCLPFDVISAVLVLGPVQGFPC